MAKPDPDLSNVLDPASDTLALLSKTMPEKSARILVAAADIFMEKGFEAASMDEIAKRAEVSKATVYAHFKSKAELFGALIRNASQVRFAPLFELDDADEEVGAALARILERLANFTILPRSLRLYRVVVAESARFPELGDLFYRAGPALVIARLAELLRLWRDKGLLDLDDPRAAAELLYSGIRSDLHMRRLLGVGSVEGAAEDPHAVIQRLVGLFMAHHAKAPLKPA